MSEFKRYVKSVLRGLGWEVHRFHPESSKVARLVAALQHFNIDAVVDVGANEGQFGEELRQGGYAGGIVSFEPMLDAHQKLLLKSRGDSRWQVHSRCALGATSGEVELNIAANSVSSSILPMLETHRNAAPNSAYNRKETVPLFPLDQVVEPYIKDARSVLLKIDTQGYEWAVLDGAAKTLQGVKGVLMELSLLPLYEGQQLWGECIRRLEAAGFTLWAVEPVFVDSEQGRTLQLDGLFFKV